jgi:hypothetical protein
VNNLSPLKAANCTFNTQLQQKVFVVANLDELSTEPIHIELLLCICYSI